MAENKNKNKISYYKDKHQLEERFIRHLRPKNTTIRLENTPMTQDDIITEIAYATALRKSEVKAVLLTLSDLALREMVINGTFKIPKVVTLATDVYKPALAHNEDMDAIVQHPPRFKIKANISSSIEKPFEEARKIELYRTYNTNADNYLKTFIVKDNINAEEFRVAKSRNEYRSVRFDNRKNLNSYKEY